MTSQDSLQVAAFLARSRANGPGLRSVLWVQGCPVRCPGCFNPDFLPFTGGHRAGVEEVVGWLVEDAATEGVTFSGGEPFAQAAALARIGRACQAAGKGVVVFTGYGPEALRAPGPPDARDLLAVADLLVAGPYERDSPSRHPLLASANQVIVHLTDRYRGRELAGRGRRVEFHIMPGGEVACTGFPGPGRGSPEAHGRGDQS